MLLYADADDPVGHAVVQRPDGTIIDPNEPGKVYASRAEWEAAHTDYHRPVSIPQGHLRQVFSQPPGPARDAVIQKLGLSSIAHRQVADGVTPPSARTSCAPPSPSPGTTPTPWRPSFRGPAPGPADRRGAGLPHPADD